MRKPLLYVLASSLFVLVADSPAERAARRLAWDIEARRTIEVRVQTDIIPLSKDHSTAPLDFNQYVEHYVETASGQRFCRRESLKQGVAVECAEDYCDGLRNAHVQFNKQKLDKQEMVGINRQYTLEDKNDRKNLPWPLLYEFVGRRPLHKALVAAEYIGEDKILGRDCDGFLFRGVRWFAIQDQVFYLDRETGTPLKVMAFVDNSKRQSNEPIWVWLAESIETQGKHHYVKESSSTSYGLDNRPYMQWKIKVLSIEFDKPYPDAMFWPSIQPGVTVFDSYTMKVIGGKPVAKPEQALDRPDAVSLPAELPTSYIDFLPTIALAGGGISIIAAIVVWKRSR